MEKCKFGDKCSFAHSQNELFKLPCWFFNNGGCKNEKCVFNHVIVQGLRKPMQIQKPCKYQNDCKNEYCQFDHFELTETEWKYHFIGIRYPGVGYYTKNQSQKQEKIKVNVSFSIDNSHTFEFGSKIELSSFPPLGHRTESKNIVNSVWQKQNIKTIEKEIQKELKNELVVPPILDVILQSEQYKYNIKKGITWADEIDM